MTILEIKVKLYDLIHICNQFIEKKQIFMNRFRKIKVKLYDLIFVINLLKKKTDFHQQIQKPSQ